MSWAAIIAAILQIFGPLISEWLKKWLESRLVKASKTVGAGADGVDDAARIGALMDAALADTPRVAFARRALIRRIRAYATVVIPNPRPLAPEEIADIKAAAAHADDD